MNPVNNMNLFSSIWQWTTVFFNSEMPTFILHTNIPKLDLELETLIHREIREIMSGVIGKSKDFILTILHSGVSMQFGETDKPQLIVKLKM